MRQLPSMLDLLLLMRFFLSLPAQDVCVEAERGKSTEVFGVMMLGER